MFVCNGKKSFHFSGDCWLELTSNTVAFTKSVMTLFEDCMKLYSSHLFHVIEDVLYEIFNIQFKVLQSAKKLHKSSESEVIFLMKNTYQTIMNERDLTAIVFIFSVREFIYLFTLVMTSFKIQLQRNPFPFSFRLYIKTRKK